MKLKILILPAFIIIELFLVIGYIKPNVDAITTKQSEITLQQDALSRVDSVAANISTISQVIESRSKSVEFIERYYPKSLDEERVVDMFNYLAQQSGIVVTQVGIKKIEKVTPVVESAPPVEGAALTLVAELPAEIPDTYEVEVSVLGEYQNIKDFFSRIYQSDRLHTTREFSVSYRKETEAAANNEGESGESIPANFLMGFIQAEFPYLKEKQVANALNIPLFQSSSFDFAGADNIFSFVTSTLPALETENVGKANPFE